MENITYEVKNNKLVITVDVSPQTIENAPRSSTGRSKLVASSHGWQSINGNGLAMSLNVNYKTR